jgi:hypothetical protein
MSFTPIPEERERVPQRPIIATLIAVVVAIGASAGIVLAGFAHDHHASSQQIRDVELQPIAKPFTQVQPPSIDLEAWGWANRDTREVRMPVSVAIDHYLARGQR